jgi:hypothetical protein
MKSFKTLMFLVASYMRHIPSGSVKPDLRLNRTNGL